MADDAPPSRPAAEATVEDAPAKAAITSSTDDTGKKGESTVSGKTGDAAVAGDDAEATKTNGSDKKVNDDTTQPAAPSTSKDSAAVPATPASTKKTPKASRRKSAANLKKTPAKNPAADQRFKEGDHVLAKMRSFPPWPAIVLSKDLLPEIMVGGNPGQKGIKSLESVGMAAWETQYPIFYMGTYEYSWMAVTDLDPLTKDKIDAGAAKKTKKLVEAFQEAQKGFTLKNVKEIQENGMELEEEPAAEAEPEEDEMDVDEGEAASEADKPKKKGSRGKKRKKSETASDEEVESEKPAKTPKKVAAKAKTPKSTGSNAAKAVPVAKTPKTPKTPANGIKASTKKGATAKEKVTPAPVKVNKSVTPAIKGKKGPKSKEAVESESEGSAPEGRIYKDVRGMSEDDQHKAMLHRRHRLQKAFLNKEKTPPNESEMNELSRCLEALESWPDMPAELIKSTKIHKVLRGILKVEFTIPLEDKYKFKERSKALHDKWMQVIHTTEKSSAIEDREDASKEEESSEGKKAPEGKENGIGGEGATVAINGDSEARTGANTGKTEAVVVKEVEMRDAPEDKAGEGAASEMAASTGEA